MSVLCCCRLRLDHARMSSLGRLSTSGATNARIEPWLPTPKGVADWPCRFDDWRRLQSWLQLKFTPSIGADPDPKVPVILVHSRHAPARFDELSQTLTWPLADSAGRWVGLALRYEGTERQRILSLEKLTESIRFWAVLALAVREDDRIDIRPYALWGDAPHLLDFGQGPTVKGQDAQSLLERLRRLVPRGTGPRSRVDLTPATDALLDKALMALLRRGELGAAGRPSELDREAQGISERLEALGLSPLASAWRTVAAASPEASSAACLRAGFALLSTRRARARLAWMD